jgi:hypothetical protein
MTSFLVISSANDPYECIKPEEDLYNCGGCSSTGQGVSCNDLAGVRGTSCTEGKCMICEPSQSESHSLRIHVYNLKDTCQRGYTLNIDEDGAQECVRKAPRRV